MLESVGKGTRILSEPKLWAALSAHFLGYHTQRSPCAPLHTHDLWEAAGGATFLQAAPVHKQHCGTFPLIIVVQDNC